MTELQHSMIVVSRVRDQELRGDMVVFPRSTAGFTVVGDDGRVGGGHIGRLNEITADDDRLRAQIAGETVEFNRLTRGGVGMRSAKIHLPDGTTRAVRLGMDVESVHLADAEESTSD